MIEPPQTPVRELYIPCFLCEDVAREGSMRFAVLERPEPVHRAPCTPLYPLNRRGLVEPPVPRDKGAQLPCFLCEEVG